jgi:hypothetical protein
MDFEGVCDFVRYEIRQSSLTRDFPSGWTDQTILFDVRTPQKDVLIQPRFVYTSRTIIGISQEGKQPALIADEYTMLQCGIVQRGPPKTRLHVVEDREQRRGNGLIRIDGDVLEVKCVAENRIREGDQSHVCCERQHKQSPVASAASGICANQVWWFRHELRLGCLSR